MKRIFTLLVILPLVSCNIHPFKKIKKVTTEHEIIKQFAAPEDWKTLTKANYSIHYPSSWKMEESVNYGNYSVTNIYNYADTDYIRWVPCITLTTLGINVTKLDPNETEDAMLENNRNTIVKEDKIVNMDSMSFYKILFTYDYKDGTRMEEEAWFDTENKYSLLFDADSLWFMNNKELAENIMSTLEKKYK